MRRLLVILALLILTSVSIVPASRAELVSQADLKIPATVPDDVSIQIHRLFSADRIERRNASLTLWEMGKRKAAAAVPYLLIMLKDDDWYVRKDAIFALRLICDVRAEKAMERLVKDDPVPAIRKAAKRALQSMKTENKGTCKR